MPPALNISPAVGSLMIPHGHIDQLEVELGRAEDEVEVAERIEVAEVEAVGSDRVVVGPAQHLGPAQGVLDVLSQQPGKGYAEKLVTQKIQKAHRLLLHRVDEADPVDEL